MGDASRAAMLVALMGGVSLPASELARLAGVSPSTATSHLRCLLDAGLVMVRAQGRHRYFALSGARVASALEGFVALGLEEKRREPPPGEISLARTCFSHFAGRVAVAFWARAASAGWVAWKEPAVELLPKGADALAERGLLIDAPNGLRGTTCVDWSERLLHVSGRLGVAVCNELLARAWVKPTGTRALRITARGQEGFRSLRVVWTE